MPEYAVLTSVKRVPMGQARPIFSSLALGALQGERILLCRHGHPLVGLVAPWELAFVMEAAGEAVSDTLHAAICDTPAHTTREDLLADLELVRQHLAPLSLAGPDTPAPELARLAVVEIMRLRSVPLHASTPAR